jgi:WD40 repeat protein
MYSGDCHFINIESGVTETTFSCQNSVINSIKQSPDGSLLLTSSLYVRPLSALWRLGGGESPDQLYSFDEDMDMSFGQSSKERLIGTQMFTANVNPFELEFL